MNIKFLLLLLLAGFFNSSCEKDENPSAQVLLPSNLTLTVAEKPESPRTVILNFAADDANFYKVYFGDDPSESPQQTQAKPMEHIYAAAGTYTIKVQAHTTERDFISQTKEITVGAGTDAGGEYPTEGYTTPESYEGMVLAWQDEFEGTQLNTSDWVFEMGNGTDGWGNRELQYYRQENTSVKDGYLFIEAKKESFGGFAYTSSRIKTQGKQEFQYGRIDIRAVVPKGQGIWPALWMLGANINTVSWPACGEIDIMELIGGKDSGGLSRDNTVHGTIHWSNDGQYANYGGPYKLSTGVFADKFHVFSIIWNAQSISWYVDDVKFHEVDITPAQLSEFHQKFFFIFNVAVGGNWPGSPDATTSFPQKMLVDYVRVFQQQ